MEKIWILEFLLRTENRAFLVQRSRDIPILALDVTGVGESRWNC
jgi:hypothetical protein